MDRLPTGTGTSSHENDRRVTLIVRAEGCEKMKTMHIVLVCHTEIDFGGSWVLFERIQPRMEQIFASVADKIGKKPKVTYCLTGEFLSDRLADAYRFLEEGHEIGIHSHLPGAQKHPREWPAPPGRDDKEVRCHCYEGPYSYKLDPREMLNQDLVAGPLRQIAASLGLPTPATHVSGMFTFQRTTIRALADAGFSVDCSLLPGVRGTHSATGDFVLADNRRRPDPYPYRPDLSDPWTDGDSAIIELPVSGNLGGGDIDGQIARLRERLDREGEIDVFQSFWHHFEFAELGGTEGTFADAEEFLGVCGQQEHVVFSTAAEAAADVRATAS